MSNIWIGQYKDVVRNYHNRKTESDKKIDEVLSMYSEEYANEIIKNIKADEEKDYYEAKGLIKQIYEKVRGYLSVASTPSVSELTADRLLFDGSYPFSLSPQEIRVLVERYRGNNTTMCRLIKDYIEEKHSGFNEYTEIASSILLPDDELKVYKTFGDSALMLIDSINSNCESPQTMSESVLAYADENFCSELFDIVGDGMNLDNFNKSRTSEAQYHCFDNVVLNDAVSFGHN